MSSSAEPGVVCTTRCMQHVALNCLGRLLVRQLAAAAVQVATKRVLLGISRRRLWRALQSQHAPLAFRSPVLEVQALQRRTNSLSRELAEEQRNYHQCLAAIAWWSQVTRGIDLGN